MCFAYQYTVSALYSRTSERVARAAGQRDTAISGDAANLQPGSILDPAILDEVASLSSSVAAAAAARALIQPEDVNHWMYLAFAPHYQLFRHHLGLPKYPWSPAAGAGVHGDHRYSSARAVPLLYGVAPCIAPDITSVSPNVHVTGACC